MSCFFSIYIPIKTECVQVANLASSKDIFVRTEATLSETVAIVHTLLRRRDANNPRRIHRGASAPVTSALAQEAVVAAHLEVGRALGDGEAGKCEKGDGEDALIWVSMLCLGREWSPAYLHFNSNLLAFERCLCFCIFCCCAEVEVE